MTHEISILLDEIHALNEELETLRADNAKLIAERDSTMASFKNFHRLLCDRFDYSHDPIDWRRDQISLIEHIANQNKESALTVCALRAEIDEYQAEREVMMKQEPYRYFNESNMSNVTADQWEDSRDLQCYYTLPLYKRPLPAQQIPEGYALVDKTELKKIHRDLDSCQKVIWLAGGFDPSYCKDAQESLKLIDAMLSASQPKGESTERPINCRNRLYDEGKACPKSGCSHCKTGGLTGCPFDKPKGEQNV